MRANLEKFQVLIDAAAEFDIQMALPKNMPTLQALSTGNYTRLDNVFISTPLINHVMECCTAARERLARTNHIPIVTELDITTDAQKETSQPNFKVADWKKVKKMLGHKLKGLETREDIHTPAELHTHVKVLT